MIRIVALLKLLLVIQSRCQTWNDTAALTNDLLHAYDSRVRPVLNQSTPVAVYVAFEVMSIKDFNEVEGRLSVVGFMYISWKDENLQWSSLSYGGIDNVILPAKEIWRPRIVLANPFNKLTDIAEDWMTALISDSGVVWFVPGDVFEVSCYADVKFYPFDRQKCLLAFVPWAFTAEKVELRLMSESILKHYYMDNNGEWNLEETSQFRIPGISELSVDTVVFEFLIKRRPTFVILNVFLPVVFMSFINILVFFLPVESGEKVSFAITVMLSQAVFLTLLVNNLPKTSQPMAMICYYIMTSLVASVCMCIATVFNVRLFYKKGEVPVWCKRLVTVFRGQTETRRTAMSCREGPKDEYTDDDNMKHATNDIEWLDISRTCDCLCGISFFAAFVLINAISAVLLFKHLSSREH